MTIRSFIKSLPAVLVVFLLAPSPASAHVIGGNGFASGITHPLLGLDHLLAMIAVGIIAVQSGGRAVWSVPLAFVSAMILGGILGMAGVQLPFVETGIAFSLLVFGSLIAVSKKLPTSLAIVCVSLFALFHGHAHGTEMTAASNPVLFTTGFILSTAALHSAGILAGLSAKRASFSLYVLKASGVAMSVAGVVFFI